MNKILIKFGLAWFRNKGIKTILYMSLYFVIRRINMFVEKFRFLVAKNIERYVRIKDMQNFTIEVNGSKMFVDWEDSGVSRQLYLHREREHYSTEYLKSIIRCDDIIIDIGANVGHYALLEARRAHKGEVYAIEPVPKNIKLLYENKYINPAMRMFIYPLAIGDRNDEGEMYLYEKGNLCSFKKNIQHKPTKKIYTLIMTLDRFVEKYVHEQPTLIRMDVEGYEYQIIKGMTKTLQIKPLILFIELHPFLMSEYEMYNLIETLKQNNFKVRAIFCEPATSDYDSISVINKIFGILDLPNLGYVGKGYDRLEWVLRRRDFSTTMVFWEKK